MNGSQWVLQKSPAKINLFLKILNRRVDGYHNIWTLFQKLKVADQVKARILSEPRVCLVERSSVVEKNRR